MRLAKCVSASVLSALLYVPGANATTISYEAVDLIDMTAGEDLWRYNYYVAGNNFSTDTGFSIYFDRNLASQLAISNINSDWDGLVFQPDPLLPADGVFDAAALVDGASLADPFSVDFVMNAGVLGAQKFEIYDSAFNVIEQGTTTARLTAAPNPVSEPPTLALLLALFIYGLFTRQPANVRRR